MVWASLLDPGFSSDENLTMSGILLACADRQLCVFLAGVCCAPLLLRLLLLLLLKPCVCVCAPVLEKAP